MTQVTNLPPPNAKLSDDPVVDRTWKDWFRQLATLGVSVYAATTGNPPVKITTVGAAGGASALPATPVGYLVITLQNVNYKIPYYNV